MTDKQFRFARTSQCYCLGQRENACSKANCTQLIIMAEGQPRANNSLSLTLLLRATSARTKGAFLLIQRYRG